MRRGVPVQLPSGEKTPDPDSPTGHVMSPVGDLAEVAATGRKIAAAYRSLPSLTPVSSAGAEAYRYLELGRHLGQGGTFEYQREGNSLSGFTRTERYIRKGYEIGESGALDAPSAR